MEKNKRKRDREDSTDRKDTPSHKKLKSDLTNDRAADTLLRFTMSKGYQMMEKMGYKEGEALGRNKNALKEPLKVKINSKRQGIRASTPDPSTANDRQMSEQEFRKGESETKNNDRLEKIWHKIQRTAFEIMGDSELYNPGNDPRDFNVLWRPYVSQLNEKLGNLNSVTNDDTEAKDDMKLMSEEELASLPADQNVKIKHRRSIIDIHIEDSELAALKELSIKERITKLNVFLRTEKYYCFFCGVKYKDESDLFEHCPGVDEEDHE